MYINETDGSHRNRKGHANREHLSSREYFTDATRNGVFHSTSSAGAEADGYEYDMYSGVDLGNFYRRLKNGELLPLTTYFKGTNSINVAEGSFEFNSIQGGANWNHKRRDGFGNYNNYLQFKTSEGFPFLYSPSNRADAAIARNSINFDDLVQRAAASIYTRGWDGGTFLAEFGQLVRMFRNIGETLATILSTLTDPRLLFTAEPAHLWLQERYGWRVLWYDLQDIAKLLSAVKDKQYDITKERKGYTVTETRDLSTTKAFTFMDVTYEAIETSVLSVRGTVVSDFIPPEIIFNPVLTAYETVKFSFVVDWVLNIGQALEAMSFALLAPNYTSAYSYVHECTFKGKVTTVTPKTGFVSGTFIQNVEQVTRVTRRVPRQLSNVPQISLNLDVFKVTDIVALIIQALSRLSGR